MDSLIYLKTITYFTGFVLAFSSICLIVMNWRSLGKLDKANSGKIGMEKVLLEYCYCSRQMGMIKSAAAMCLGVLLIIISYL